MQTTKLQFARGWNAEKLSLRKRLPRGLSHVLWGHLRVKTEQIEDLTLRSKLISE